MPAINYANLSTQMTKTHKASEVKQGVDWYSFTYGGFEVELLGSKQKYIFLCMHPKEDNTAIIQQEDSYEIRYINTSILRLK